MYTLKFLLRRGRGQLSSGLSSMRGLWSRTFLSSFSLPGHVLIAEAYAIDARLDTHML